jgi:hypothetical protein
MVTSLFKILANTGFFLIAVGIPCLAADVASQVLVGNGFSPHDSGSTLNNGHQSGEIRSLTHVEVEIPIKKL